LQKKKKSVVEWLFTTRRRRLFNVKRFTRLTFLNTPWKTFKRHNHSFDQVRFIYLLFLLFYLFIHLFLFKHPWPKTLSLPPSGYVPRTLLLAHLQLRPCILTTSMTRLKSQVSGPLGSTHFLVPVSFFFFFFFFHLFYLLITLC
jgi:hypothetical protein